MNRRRFLAAAGGFALAPRWAQAQQPVHALRFSALRPGAALPQDYRPYVFAAQARHTEYAVVEDGGRSVLRARAQASTAGIVRDLRIDPRALPILAWRWKAIRLPERSDIATRAGDDYAARLYVVFDLKLAALPLAERAGVTIARVIYGEDVPAAALCYVWDARASVGTVVPNAYTGRVRMVVVESGTRRLGRWLDYERDILQDYRAAFGAEAPAVRGVVVSTDTDNTGSSAEAYYGDVLFRARPPS